jgi:hypothetical protein
MRVDQPALDQRELGPERLDLGLESLDLARVPDRQEVDRRRALDRRGRSPADVFVGSLMGARGEPMPDGPTR